MWTKIQVQGILDQIAEGEDKEIIEISLQKDKAFFIKWMDLDEHQHLVECEQTVLPGYKPTVTMLKPRD